MADVALSADDVGRIVQYVAPGFFARVSYEARFPQPERSALNTTIWSVAASLPLVAIGNGLADALDTTMAATDWQYVAVLLVPAVIAGYTVAWVRGRRIVRTWLRWLGLHHQPDGSLYAQTMLGLSPGTPVTVELADGRKLSGTPRAGPSLAEEAVEEIVLTHPAWLGEHGWEPEGAGKAVLVPLSQVRTVTYAEDPFD